MDACMDICMHACMNACMHACMSACMHACMNACMHACTCLLRFCISYFESKKANFKKQKFCFPQKSNYFLFFLFAFCGVAKCCFLIFALKKPKSKKKKKI